MAVYRLIAEAESRAHGVPVNEIHFHEVGTMDAVADITAVCLLMNRLAPDEVVVSPVRVGSGQVRCAHGILPVPAPATAFILQQVPIYGGNIRGELCTPTGAALLRHFASSFGDMPVMRTESVGYGMGKKDFEAIAVVGCRSEHLATEEYKKGILPGYCPPCGICRQVMREFTDPNSFKIILARSVEDLKIYTLEELLVDSFGPENL